MEKSRISAFRSWQRTYWKLFLSLFAICFSCTQLLAQTIRVGGTIRDSKGAALSGISVTVKGASTGTTTDANGGFTINAPSKEAVLVFSGVGFLPKEVTVGDQHVINLTMADKNNDLDEVIVIGYGQTQKK
jgi:hypothetical protein